MAKQIIVLEKNGPGNFTIAYWLVVPASRFAFYANPAATSKYKEALPAEITEIQVGHIKERVESFSVEGALPPLATIQAALEANYAKYQTQLDEHNPWVQYGMFWDGVTWTSGGVA